MTKKDAEKAVAAVLETVTETLKKGDKITLTGFGSFEVRPARLMLVLTPRPASPSPSLPAKLPFLRLVRR